jgi:hypothetical protein
MDAGARTDRISAFVAAWKEYRTLLEKVEDRDFKYGVVVSRDGSRLNDLALRFAESEVLREE